MQIERLLKEYKTGRLGIDDVMQKLKVLPYEDLDFAKIDFHRELRKGFPEIIYGPGKTVEQLVLILRKMQEHHVSAICTRIEKEKAKTLKKKFKNALYFGTAKIFFNGIKPKAVKQGIISVICAGTSDMPVAEEAAVIAELLGNRVQRIYDVGVAGIHRLFNQKDKIFSSNVIIVAAGMEGALPSVVAGIADVPVIALPTSVGYGASFGGVSALLSMLNSCAPGIAVVNIDNGVGAAVFAAMINK